MDINDQNPYAAGAAEPTDPAVDALAVTPLGPPVRPWLTLLLTLAAMIAYVVMTIVAVAVVLIVTMSRHPGMDVDAWAQQVETDGDLMSVASWAATIVLVPLVLLFAWLVSGQFAAEHLGLRMPRRNQLVLWILLCLALAAFSDGLTVLLGRDVVPEWMRATYASTQYAVFLWLTLIVAAPVGEELLFRGFLFDGLARSRIGPIAAAVIASLAWSVIHLQYDFYGISMIFLGGLLLAAARYYTRSVFICMAMHAVQNLVATLEVVML